MPPQTQPLWTDEYHRMLADCRKRAPRMTEWEQQFCTSLAQQLEQGRTPTDKQIETLDRIWEKVTAQG